MIYKPKVSIVMATYNRAPFLRVSIGSVLWQTYPNWELIVVDDGSKDNTQEAVNSFKDRRIKYINKGHHWYYTAVRNTGIKYSDGELLAFRDDDGAWNKYFLEELVKPHKAKDVVLTYCGRVVHRGIKLEEVSLEDLDSLPVSRKPPLVQWQGQESLANEVDVGDFVIKRSVFRGKFQGFRDELDHIGYCSDAKLIDDIQKYNPGGKFVMINKRLHHYFLEHGKSQMTLRKLEARKKGKLTEEKKWEF